MVGIQRIEVPTDDGICEIRYTHKVNWGAGRSFDDVQIESITIEGKDSNFFSESEAIDEVFKRLNKLAGGN